MAAERFREMDGLGSEEFHEQMNGLPPCRPAPTGARRSSSSPSSSIIASWAIASTAKSYLTITPHMNQVPWFVGFDNTCEIFISDLDSWSSGVSAGGNCSSSDHQTLDLPGRGDDEEVRR